MCEAQPAWHTILLCAQHHRAVEVFFYVYNITRTISRMPHNNRSLRNYWKFFFRFFFYELYTVVTTTTRSKVYAAARRCVVHYTQPQQREFHYEILVFAKGKKIIISFIEERQRIFPIRNARISWWNSRPEWVRTCMYKIQ